MRVRAHYAIHVETADTIWIVDLDDGAMSVTNDAEAVVEQVVKDFGDKRVIYRDSEGQWDELLHHHGRFIDFAPGRGELDPQT